MILNNIGFAIIGFLAALAFVSWAYETLDKKITNKTIFFCGLFGLGILLISL